MPKASCLTDSSHCSLKITQVLHLPYSKLSTIASTSSLSASRWTTIPSRRRRDAVRRRKVVDNLIFDITLTFLVLIFPGVLTGCV